MRGISHISAVCVIAVGIQFGGGVVAAQAADALCSEPDYAQSLPAPPNGCHRERISASGNERPSVTWARTSALEHWRDQVINKYGERFAVWKNTACPKRECVPGAIAGMTRCTYSGFACSIPPADQVSNGTDDGADDAVGGLSRQEIREMQRLLKSYGYKVSIDGIFGRQSRRALRKWQRARSLEVDARPVRRNLELLRKYA